MWKSPTKITVIGAFFSLSLFASCASDASFSGQSPQVNASKQEVATQDAIAVMPNPEKIQSKPLQKFETLKINKVFQLEETLENKVQIVLGHQTTSETIELKNEYLDEKRQMAQEVRPLLTQFFMQGNSGLKSTETFNQKNLGILDLLLVVDNSGSMDKEQDNLSKKLSALLQHIDESDWRINVVTTDSKDGCSRALLKKGDPDLMKVFQDAVTPGTSGSGYEEGIRMAVEGLSCKTVDWVRPQSSIAVLIVSDEDNCSLKGQDCKDSGFDQPQALTNHLETKLGRILGKTARVYGIFWEPGTKCDTGKNEAFQYSELVKATKGQWGSICDKDYAPTLRRISADVNDILISEVELKNQPDAGTLKVFVNGTEISGGYRLENKKLIFEKSPPYQSQIEVQYSHGATPLFKRFPMADLPAVETIQVVIKNKIVDPTAYFFDDVDRSLVFLDFPEDNSEIKVQARKRLPLKRDFEIGTMPENYTAQVSIDGKVVSKFKIDNIDGLWILTFEEAPKDGQKILLSLRIDQGPVLEYPLTMAKIPGFVLDAIVDLENGTPVKFELNGDLVNLPPEVVKAHKKLKAIYTTAIAKDGEFLLPDGIKGEDVKIFGPESEKLCRLSGSIDNSGMIYLDCALPAGSVVTLGWEYKKPMAGKFKVEIQSQELGELSLEEFMKASKWTLKIDGQPITAYTREGQTIQVDEIPQGAKILEIEIEAQVEI